MITRHSRITNIFGWSIYIPPSHFFPYCIPQWVIKHLWRWITIKFTHVTTHSYFELFLRTLAYHEPSKYILVWEYFQMEYIKFDQFSFLVKTILWMEVHLQHPLESIRP